MGAQGHLIGELQGVLENRDPSGRADVLRRVTDLFIGGSGRFTDDQIELFGDVMSRLVGTIGRAARAEFGSRLALALLVLSGCGGIQRIDINTSKCMPIASMGLMIHSSRWLLKGVRIRDVVSKIKLVIFYCPPGQQADLSVRP